MNDVDACILGGGLAGLSLGIQLKRARAKLRILVLERRKHPVREAAFKVGESTVEVGAHYFAEELGLKQHIKARQLPKLGPRFFFDATDNRDISRRVELGGTMFSPTPSYQLDRGRFENFLGEEARRIGVEFLDGSTIRGISLDGEAGHKVTWRIDSGESRSIVSRWVVDATGRAAFLKRKNQLHESAQHKANAVWFRLDERIKIDDWTTDESWRKRTGSQGAQRWLSTNHLMGRGYWIWLIPLASGSTSVGLVCDSNLHEFESMNSFPKALAWMQRHEPQCAEIIRKHEKKLQDFIGFRDFSYSSKQVFSADRWCLTGEAGVFLDPFYSPGCDFIAFSNSFITDLIEKDSEGKSVRGIAEFYNDIFMQFFDRQFSLYQGQYPIFGNSRVMPVKILWDFVYYWSVPAFIYFHKRLCDLSMYGACQSLFRDVDQVNSEMQSFFRLSGHVEQSPLENRFVDITQIPLMVRLNRQLNEPISATDFIPRLKANIRDLKLAAIELKSLGTDSTNDAVDSLPMPVATQWFAGAGQVLYG